MTKFHYTINNGPVRTIKVTTGVYIEAAAAIPAMVCVEYPVLIKIWVPELLPDYGPYLYRIEHPGAAVHIAVETRDTRESKSR